MRFKNGSEYEDGMVRVHHALLRNLLDSNGVLFYELVMHCRNSKHEFFGDTKAALTKAGWLDVNGKAHSITRDFVEEFVAGDGIEMELLPHDVPNPG